jgi:DNA-cytosine methyltransferase
MLGRYAISDTLKIGSLCTGYGGLDMAVEAYFGAKTAWVSEIDKYACKVIDARINKPNIGNLKIVNWAEVEPVDIITAGYPCQPFSTAGKRKGVQDERHLWPYIKEAISTIRPSIVFLENVRGHFGLGFRDVLTDLASIGYDVRWSLIRASDVGAPHRTRAIIYRCLPQKLPRWQLPCRISQAYPKFRGCVEMSLLPTPTASDKNDRQKSKNWKGDDLVSQVKTLNIPTPTASDSHWENTEAQRAGILGNHNLSLVEWARLSTRKMYRLHWIKVN